MIGVILGLLLPIAAARMLIAALSGAAARANPPLTGALAVPLAFGLSSITTFLFVAAGLELGPWFVAADASCWTLLSAALWWGSRPPADGAERGARAAQARIDRVTRAAQAGFAVVALVAVATLLIDYRTAPHGEWDAWAIWNQKARFLLRGGEGWTAALTIPWSNPAHPLLVSVSVARLWAYGGEESTLVPELVALAFTASLVIVVVATLGLRRPRGWIAGTVLLAPGFVLQQMTSQQADVPLACFMVSALVTLLCPPFANPERDGDGALLLAGTYAGLAAWTKNEGLVLLAVLLVVVGVRTFAGRRLRTAIWWGAGAAPALACVVWLKLVLAPVPPPYLLEPLATATLIDRVAGAAAWEILGTIGRLGVEWGGPAAAGILPLTLAGAVALSIRAGGPAAVIFGVALAMCAAYLAVFVATPLDAVELLVLTFDRVLIQVWPVIILAAGLAVPEA